MKAAIVAFGLRFDVDDLVHLVDDLADRRSLCGIGLTEFWLDLLDPQRALCSRCCSAGIRALFPSIDS